VTYRYRAQVIQVAQDRDDGRPLDVSKLNHVPIQPDDLEIHDGPDQACNCGLK
jgi:hypothetical protein